MNSTYTNAIVMKGNAPSLCEEEKAAMRSLQLLIGLRKGDAPYVG